MTANAIASPDSIRDRVRDARARGIPLRIAGRGNWLDAGRSVHAAEFLSTRDLSGITEYVPGDLTITARAGTTLDEIRDACATYAQWLALDPSGSGDGTIGATLATTSAGPLSTYFGGPRDLALGVEFVTGEGVLARGGGRVVKNVAGFDLTRLVTGSWGTLAVITEATLRLHARPEADETLAVRLDDGAVGVARLAALLSRLPFTPFACEVVNDALALALGGGGAAAIVRIGGNPDSVRAQRAAFAEFGEVADVDPSVWAELRSCEPAGSMVFRLSGPRSEIARVWGDALGLAIQCPGTLLHGRPARGVVRCIVPAGHALADTLRDTFTHTPNARRVGERLPPGLWPLCSPPPADDRISRGIKARFDPAGILNPGIFGEIS
ncbi:MAG: FAD-binding oxidoreductase [Gemmatimonadales bacterium]